MKQLKNIKRTVLWLAMLFWQHDAMSAIALRSFPPLLLSPSENAYCMMFDHRGVLWIGRNG